MSEAVQEKRKRAVGRSQRLQRAAGCVRLIEVELGNGSIEPGKKAWYIVVGTVQRQPCRGDPLPF